MDSGNSLQTQLISTQEQIDLLEAAVELQLRRLSTWTRLPDTRTDWALEGLLDELRTSCLAIRQLRGDADLPF